MRLRTQPRGRHAQPMAVKGASCGLNSIDGARGASAWGQLERCMLYRELRWWWCCGLERHAPQCTTPQQPDTEHPQINSRLKHT